MKDINHLLDDVELQQKNRQRFYLGMSQIGNPNQRLLWMRYRWLMPDDMPARVLRLLDLGNVVEDDLIKKLRKIPGAQILMLPLMVNSLRHRHWEATSKVTSMA